MAPIFHNIKVKNIIRETRDAVSIYFDIPTELNDIFHYNAGQYVTIKVPVESRENRRAYSISSSPEVDKDFFVTVKKVDQGVVSVYLNENLKIGDSLEVMPPMGSFSPAMDNNKQNYVLFAGGSGISPLYSILKSVLASDENTNICLFYANRSINSIIFYDELKALEAKYINRFKVVFTLTEYDENWSGQKGRFNSMNVSVLIHRHAETIFRNAEHYLCGPQGMMRQIENALDILSIDKKNIRKESFTAPLPNELGDPETLRIKKSLQKREVKVKLYGEIISVMVEPDETLTNALQRYGSQPPLSCQIGACSTCRAKVTAGEFIMDEREALTDEEMQDGYILTCQSHPITDNCFVDYD